MSTEPWSKAKEDILRNLMSYELVVRSGAKADIRRAAKRYERQREGLGKDFVFEVDNAIRRIETNPEQFQVVYRDMRRPLQLFGLPGLLKVELGVDMATLRQPGVPMTAHAFVEISGSLKAGHATERGVYANVRHACSVRG